MEGPDNLNDLDELENEVETLSADSLRSLIIQIQAEAQQISQEVITLNQEVRDLREAHPAIVKGGASWMTWMRYQNMDEYAASKITSFDQAMQARREKLVSDLGKIQGIAEEAKQSMRAQLKSLDKATFEQSGWKELSASLKGGKKAPSGA